MDRRPTDVDGLVLPAVQPEAAWDAAEGLTAVARSLGAALDVLDGAPATALCWSGEAADGYRTARKRLARRTSQVAELAAAGAGVVLTWLREAAPALAAMRAVAAELTEVQRRVEVASTLAYDPVLDARLQSEVDDGYRRWHAALDAYWGAVDVASRRLVALRDVVDDRPLDAQDQVEGAIRSAWQGYVSEPAAATWGLTGLAVVDRDRWWDNVSGLPGATADTVTAVVTDPLGTVRTLADWDEWSAGHYGAAGGGLAAMFLPGPRWLGVGKDLGAVRFAKNLADPRAPLPRLQTVDEILTDGIDLDRHEHYVYGHTLRRHVDVDHDYLMDRLVNGTLEDEARRGYIPPEASRFADRATAEETINEALASKASDLRALERAPIGKTLIITYPAGRDIGEVMTRAPDGFIVERGHSLLCVLRRSPDGVHVVTAYVSK